MTPIGRMGSDARRLVEALPAAKLGFNPIRQCAQHRLNTDAMHQLHHLIHADKWHKGPGRRQGGVIVGILLIVEGGVYLPGI